MAVTWEPNSSSANVATAANAASSVNRWLAPRPVDPRRVVRADRHVDEQPDERHRRREVRRDRLAGVAEADGLAAEPGLEARPAATAASDGRGSSGWWRWSIAGEERDAEDHEPDDRRDRAMDPLDPRLVVVERREQLAVAQRPVGAAQPGIRRPDDHADRHEQQGQSRRSPGRASGSGSRPRPDSDAWRRVRTDVAATLTSAMRPHSPPPRARREPASSPACGALQPGGTAAPLRRPVPAPASAERRERRASSRSSSARARSPGPNRFLFSFLDPQDQPPGGVARPQGVGGVHLARARRSPGPPPRPSSSGRSRASGRLRRERGARRGRRLQGACSRREAPGSPAGGDPASTSRSAGRRPPSRSARGAGDRQRRRWPSRRRRRQDLDRRDPDPAFYETSVEGRPRREEPVRPRLRHAGVLPEPRSAARPSTGSRRSRQGAPDVAFINVEPYQLEYTDGRLQPVLDANDQLQPVEAVDEWGLLTEPWVFVVDGDRHGAAARSRAMIGDDELEPLDRGDQRQLGRRRGRRRVRRRVLQPVRDQVVALDAEVTRRPASTPAWCSARWLGGNSSPFSSWPMRNVSSLPVVGPDREAGPRRGRSASTSIDDALDRRGERSGPRAAWSWLERRATTAGDGEAATRQPAPAARAEPRGPARVTRASGRCRVLPGLRAARRRRTAGSRARARTSAGPAPTAPAAGRRGRSSATSASASPPERSTSTAHSDDLAAQRLDGRHHRQQRAAGRQDVVDEQHALAGRRS